MSEQQTIRPNEKRNSLIHSKENLDMANYALTITITLRPEKFANGELGLDWLFQSNDGSITVGRDGTITLPADNAWADIKFSIKDTNAVWRNEGNKPAVRHVVGFPKFDPRPGIGPIKIFNETPPEGAPIDLATTKDFSKLTVTNDVFNGKLHQEFSMRLENKRGKSFWYELSLVSDIGQRFGNDPRIRNGGGMLSFKQKV